MTTTKKQLFTAVAMLVVAAMALGTATYAWFVNNATVTVDEMNFNASTSTSMEIALANSTDLTTAGAFKGAILTADLNTFFKGRTGGDFGDAYMSNVTLIPASTTAPTAHTNFFRAADNGWDNAAQTVTTFTAIEDPMTTSGAGVFRVPMYLRASEDIEVYLTTGTSITVSANAATNQAIYAMRMAIVPSGGTPIIFQAKATNDNIGELSRNTTTLITEGTDPGKAIPGLNADNTAKTPIAQNAKHLVEGLLFDPSPAVAGGSVINLIPATTDMTGKEKIMELKTNEAKAFDVYVWLEGCDFDCVTAVAKGDFDINLQFIGKQIAPLAP